MSLLPETGRRVTGIAARAQSAGRAPSLALAVVRDRSLLHFTGAGETPPPDPKTQYRLGSITKTLTATMIMQLRDEGFFGLDDLLYRHLPGTPVGGITLRQLLGHVSGLQREPDGPWWERNAGVSLDRLLTDLAPDKIAGPPFRNYHYSNLAYGLLGAVLQRVTGESWADLVGKRVLDPLGMKRTTYSPVEPFARGYVVHALDGSLHEEPRLDAGAMAPAGQLWSTVTDMAKWAAFLADPAPAVLSRETIDEMCTPVVMQDETWTAGHGLGPELHRVGERVYVGHGGSMPGYNSQLLVHRPSRTGVIAFTNAYGLRGTGLRAVALEALTTVLDAEPAPPPPWRPAPAPRDETAELCGRWWWMGSEYEVNADGEDLVMAPAGYASRPPWRFTREAPDRWRGTAGANTGEVLTVRRDPDGGVRELEIATFVFSRDPYHLA
ncbi:serine hydrolase domain-containing protein [Pseudosporangium ferrugineum]|uniref:CubicO group peptidase (Beta-lactamase class C family) n=1 Tax=Pseudosporangium ferrugineum TaxID=439699 RepID=A0A2T0S8V4_9ACTN|nr:serine hydrolase domain-containing protein [Pseudosporangium ferrugineum]PRY29859.1 CubicO group peptidase (beta-lactamase class C family) [Pseudosporangium ferrugineum]